ncbi:leukotriene C4 synthase isoform X4 [Mastomys coucha]|uniref:leukotriene C4 synthase isoform X4 n=1 Tax=Mastomys coucha TaxID=35658 RepID=UPI001261AAA2|nr:leukotriene C4 synthase isoform X4 [Mastomys coucha]
MAEALPLVGQRLSAHWVIRTLKLILPVADNMKDDVALLATVTLVGVLLQAYFSLQVISARRTFHVSPPLTSGPPEFERVFRAQVNCSEYFPLFLATLWIAGIFFHEGAAALCGLFYLFARLRYFQGYARSAQLRWLQMLLPVA